MSDEHRKRDEGEETYESEIAAVSLKASETLGDGGSPKAVVLLRLISESEESEEDKCAKDDSPSIDLKHVVAKLPVYQDPWNLVDTIVFPVRISPGDPWVNLVPRSVNNGSPNAYRDGETEVDRS